MSKNKKKKKKYFRLAVIIIPIVISLISLIISIKTVRITIKEANQNELILVPRFSLEKNIDEDNNSFIWKISNLGGAINNATIYSIMHVSFFVYDEDQDDDIEVILELSDYYSTNNCYYRNSDGSFYIKDDKHSELDDFITKYASLFESNGVEYSGYNVSSYFTMHFEDYKGNTFNKIYTIIDEQVFGDDSERIVFGETMKQLEEVSDIPDPDIIAPLKFDTTCVIYVYYKNAITQQIIEDERNYNDYLYFVILDLFDSKNKPIYAMYGEYILSNGMLWRRDVDTRELVLVANDVKDFGYIE